MFFAPPLGLFNLLKHLQAEQTQWDPEIIEHFVDKNKTITFGNISIPWKDIDRWENHPIGIQPPHYTIYTSYNLFQFFIFFWIIMLAQCIFVYFAKWKFSYSFARARWLEKMIHVMENTHIPYNFEEWDAIKIGGVKAHIDRMRRNCKETTMVMIINSLFNFVLLIPLGLLGNPIFISNNI